MGTRNWLIVDEKNETVGQTDDPKVVKEARDNKYGVRVIMHDPYNDAYVGVAEEEIKDAYELGFREWKYDDQGEKGLKPMDSARQYVEAASWPQAVGVEIPAPEVETADYNPNKQAVTRWERFAVKNLLEGYPIEAHAEFLERQGYETRIVDGKLQARRRDPPTTGVLPARTKFGTVEPQEKLEFQDASDVLVDALEMAGQTAGSVVGANPALGPMAPAGAILGSGLGGMMARSAAELAAVVSGVKEKFDREPGLKSLASGMVGEGIGRGLSFGIKGVGKGFGLIGPEKKTYQIRPDHVPEDVWHSMSDVERRNLYQQDIREATAKVGANPNKITPGMKFDSEPIQKIERGFREETGMIGGRKVRKNLRDVQDSVLRAAQSIFDRTVGYKRETLGKEAKEAFLEELSGKLEPLEKIYEHIDAETGHLPADVSGILEVIRDLKVEKRDSDSAMALLNKWENKVSQVKTIGELARFRTNGMSKEMKPIDDLTDNEKEVRDLVYSATTRARTDSLMKIGEESAKQIREHIRQSNIFPVDEEIYLFYQDLKSRKAKIPLAEFAKSINSKVPRTLRVEKIEPLPENVLKIPQGAKKDVTGDASIDAEAEVVRLRPPVREKTKKNRRQNPTDEYPSESKITFASRDAIIKELKKIYDADPQAATLISNLASEGYSEPFFGVHMNNRYGTHFFKEAGYEVPPTIPVYGLKPSDLDGELGKYVPYGGVDPFSAYDKKYRALDILMDDPTFKETPLTIRTRSSMIANDSYLSRLNPEKHNIKYHVISPVMDDFHVRNLLGAKAKYLDEDLFVVAKLRNKGFKVDVVLDDPVQFDPKLRGTPGFNRRSSDAMKAVGGGTVSRSNDEKLFGSYAVEDQIAEFEKKLKNMEYDPNDYPNELYPTMSSKVKAFQETIQATKDHLEKLRERKGQVIDRYYELKPTEYNPIIFTDEQIEMFKKQGYEKNLLPEDVRPSYLGKQFGTIEPGSDMQVIREYKDIIEQLKATDRDYAQIAEGTRVALLGLQGASKSKRENPYRVAQRFLDKTEDVKAVDTMFPTNRPQQLQAMKEVAPNTYDKLAKSQMAAILNESLSKIRGQERVDPNKLVRLLDPDIMPESTAKELFGDNSYQKLKAMRFIIKNYPDIINYSGTDQAGNLRKLTEIRNQIKSLKQSTVFNLIKSPAAMESFANTLANLIGSKPIKAGVSQYLDETITPPAQTE